MITARHSSLDPAYPLLDNLLAVSPSLGQTLPPLSAPDVNWYTGPTDPPGDILFETETPAEGPEPDPEDPEENPEDYPEGSQGEPEGDAPTQTPQVPEWHKTRPDGPHSRNTGTGHYWTIDGQPWELSQKDIDDWNAIHDRGGWAVGVEQFLFTFFFTDEAEITKRIQNDARSYRSKYQQDHKNADPWEESKKRKKIVEEEKLHDGMQLAQTIDTWLLLLSLWQVGAQGLRPVVIPGHIDDLAAR